ncbi:MAG TPA: MFS transporter [Actinomycetota bacterium]|nr:MFS transporter [Actinomycetota bacterium]
MSYLRGLIDRRLSFLSDQPLVPISMLFLLNALDEFDRAAFGTLAPEIRDTFGLSNTGFGLIVGFTSVLVLLGGLPVGLLGDRMPRTKLVAAAAVLWGTMSILTGVAPVLWLLIVARFGSGIGRVSNEAIHTSLLTDYYPIPMQGRVFALHRAANPIGLTLGPFIAGSLAAVFDDYRPVFVIVAIPTFIAAVVSLRLREPDRGESENFVLAASVAAEGAIPLSRAWRRLMGISSLKRLYVAAFFGGGAIFALFPFLSLFFEDVFGIEEQGRGFIGAGNGLSQLVGTIVGGVATDRLRRRSMGSVTLVAGGAVAMIGPGLLLAGISESFGVSVSGSFIAYLAIGVWTAPTVAVLSVVIPARMRSLGIGVGVMFFGVGGLIFATTAGLIADGPGLRAAITSLAPVLILAGFITLSASKFVDADGRRALQSLALDVELAQQRIDATDQAMLVVRGVSAAYDGVPVLFDVDFEARPGELIAVLGTNGAGKSTLLGAISGVVPATSGAIFFDGQDITGFEPHETAGAGIVQVPGGRGVFPGLTVKENIELAGWLSHKDPAHLERAIAEVKRIFPWMVDRWNAPASQISGGEQQMVTLSQAFVARPKLLMIDELSLGLSPLLVDQLVKVVQAINSAGTTVVLVEQSASLALSVSDRAYFLEKGRVRFEGSPRELRSRSDLLRSVYLAKAVSSTSRKRTKVVDTGRPPVLEVRAVSKTFESRKVLHEVSFDLRAGAITGLIGPNGAGKTTLFDVISGFEAADSGSVFLMGRDVAGVSPETRSEMGLARSFQGAPLFKSLTVLEAVKVAMDRHVKLKEPVAAALGLPAVRASENQAAQSALTIIESVGLLKFKDKFISELSTGTRRIVDIACALAHRPTVLIMDEPSSGLSQAETEAIGPLLLETVKELDCALLLIEHDTAILEEVADEVVALGLGRVISRGSARQVLADPIVAAAYLGKGRARSAASKRSKAR